jgi:hypothetical protein
MKKELRIQKLKEIQKGDSFGYGVKIPYRGTNLPFKTYQIPLDYLIYNKYNGRIRSLVKTYEKHYHNLDPENSIDVLKIEEYLWKSNKTRNENTEANIVELGQRVHGIVTADGKIIDGNRRAMILKKIYSQRNTRYSKQNLDDCQFFIAAILPDDIEDKEIRKLETIYQMGEDTKLDYNAIEKYLMVKELLEENDFDFEVEDVAKWMGQTTGKIKEWKETMVLMDEYLQELGYQEIYTMLDKREDLFLSLNKYMKRFERGNISNGDWSPTENDVADLKLISYDYIRAQYEGKLFRSIGQGSKGENFFSAENIWKPFKDYHFENIEPITENEKSVEEWRRDNQDADISDFLPRRDEEWTENTNKILGTNFSTAYSQLDDKKKENEPLELITKAKNALDSINEETESLLDLYIDNMLKDMISRINELRKIIKKSGL